MSEQSVALPLGGGPTTSERTRSKGRRARLISQLLIGLFDVTFGAALLVLVPSLRVHGYLVPGAALVICVGAHGRARVSLSVLTQLPNVLRRVSIPLLSLVAVSEFRSLSPRAAISSAGVLVAVIAARSCSYGVVRTLRRRGLLVENAVIVGVGDLGLRLRDIFRAHREFGVNSVGFVDKSGSYLPKSYLGDIENLPAIVAQHDVQKVFVAFGIASEEVIARKLQVEIPNVDVIVVPRLFEAGGGSSTDAMVDHAWGIPLVWLPRRLARRSSRLLKQALDSTIALVFLVVLSPLLILTAIAVRLSGPGPILFRQVRLGRDHKPFELLKFRSMAEASDDLVRWGADEDYRVTPVGRLIRSASIDELPQLLNVLRGEMSIVGPRPERPVFAKEFEKTVDQYALRLRAPVGLTGWAQVNRLRGDSSIADRVRFDNYYIDNWSLWTDMRIVVQTFGALKAPRNVPEQPKIVTQEEARSA